MGNSSESIERGREIHRVVDSPAQEAVCLVDGATGEHVLPSVIVVEVARLSVPPVLEFAGLCVCACAFSVWKRAATCTYYTHRGFTTAGTLQLLRTTPDGPDQLLDRFFSSASRQLYRRL